MPPIEQCVPVERWKEMNPHEIPKTWAFRCGSIVLRGLRGDKRQGPRGKRCHNFPRGNTPEAVKGDEKQPIIPAFFPLHKVSGGGIVVPGNEKREDGAATGLDNSAV